MIFCIFPEIYSPDPSVIEGSFVSFSIYAEVSERFYEYTYLYTYMYTSNLKIAILLLYNFLSIAKTRYYILHCSIFLAFHFCHFSIYDIPPCFSLKHTNFDPRAISDSLLDTCFLSFRRALQRRSEILCHQFG